MADPHDELGRAKGEGRGAKQPGDDPSTDSGQAPPWGGDDAVLAMWASLDDEWAPMDFEALVESAAENNYEVWKLWAERTRGR